MALNKRTRQWMRAELDRLARFCCLARAGHQCEKCGKLATVNGKGELVGLQWHHVYTRALIALRWDMDNLLCLCPGCHLWWHHNPLEASTWFVERYGQARADRLRLIRGTPRRVDVEGTLVAVQELARRYGYAHTGTEG